MSPPPRAYDDGLDVDVSDFDEDESGESEGDRHQNCSSDAEPSATAALSWPDPFDTGTEASSGDEKPPMSSMTEARGAAAASGAGAVALGAGTDRVALALAEDPHVGGRRLSRPTGFGYYMRNPLAERDRGLSDLATTGHKRKRARDSSQCSSQSSEDGGTAADGGAAAEGRGTEARRGRKRKGGRPPCESSQAKQHRRDPPPEFEKMSSEEMNSYVRWWRKMHALTWKGGAGSRAGALPSSWRAGQGPLARPSMLPSGGPPSALVAAARAAAASSGAPMALRAPPPSAAASSSSSRSPLFGGPAGPGGPLAAVPPPLRPLGGMMHPFARREPDGLGGFLRPMVPLAPAAGPSLAASSSSLASALRFAGVARPAQHAGPATLRYAAPDDEGDDDFLLQRALQLSLQQSPSVEAPRR